MNKVDRVQKQMGNVSRDAETLKKEPKRNARDKKTSL